MSILEVLGGREIEFEIDSESNQTKRVPLNCEALEKRSGSRLHRFEDPEIHMDQERSNTSIRLTSRREATPAPAKRDILAEDPHEEERDSTDESTRPSGSSSRNSSIRHVDLLVIGHQVAVREIGVKERPGARLARVLLQGYCQTRDNDRAAASAAASAAAESLAFTA